MANNKPIPKPLIDNPDNPKAATNTRIINTVRKRAGLGFADRVTKATQGNIQQTIDQLDSYTPDWNTFINVLLNGQVVDLFRTNDFTNPLGRYKMASVVDNGTWIRELGYNLIKAKSYDKHATDVFDVEEPEIHANYHIQNRKDRYDLSVSEDILKQAMLSSETGLATLINQILSIPYTSAEEDEYLIMRQLFMDADNADPFFNVNIPDITEGTPDEKAQTGAIIAQKIREMYLQFPFLHSEFNAEGLPVKCDDPLLVCTPKFLSNFDVMVLANAFNMDKTNFMGQVQIVDDLPFSNVGNHGATAILMDPKFFVAADTKVKAAQIYNPKNDVNNYFLHRWGIYSASRFVNRVLFSARPDTTESINVVTPDTVSVSIGANQDGTTPKYATRGTTVNMDATVTPEGANDAVVWDIVGTSGKPKSTNTYIDGRGQLWVGTDEKNEWLLIRATSVEDTTKSAAIRVGIDKVAPEITAITKVTVDGENPKAGAETTYTATVTGDADNSVIWSVYGAPDANTKIDNGVLSVDPGVAAGTNLTIVAVSRLNPDVSGSKVVTVQAA